MKTSVMKRAIIVFLLIETIAMGIGYLDYRQNKDFNGNLNRPGSKESQKIYTLLADTDLGKSKIEVAVSPIQIDEKEAKKLIENAINEIDTTFFGENKSPEKVNKDIYMASKYVDGEVTANWRLDNYRVVDSDGRIIFENIQEDTVVTAYCDLMTGNESYTYTFPFIVTLPDFRTEEGFEYFLRERLKEIDKSGADNEMISLPNQIGEVKVRWMKEKSYRALQIAILGFLVGGFIIISKKEEEKQLEKERNRSLTRDYPDIVSNLSLYVGAGINIKNALTKTAENYLKQKLNNNISIRQGFEEIVITGNEMKDGKGELEALRQLGKRSGHRDYRRLSLILIQNSRKGNEQIIELLEKEEKSAFDDRKTRARILGEEASTKLLIPMFGLLSIVLIMLIFPALSGYKI